MIYGADIFNIKQLVYTKDSEGFRNRPTLFLYATEFVNR